MTLEILGQGQQLIYIYPPHIGDTLNVIGCIENVCEETEFIVRYRVEM